LVGRRIGELEVESIDDLGRIVADRGIAIAILATPAAAAQDVTDRLVAAGVTSILNFAPSVCAVPDGVSMRKVDLAIELQILSFYQLRRAAPAAPAS
jgi:redox-sensing transcriptional repressor